MPRDVKREIIKTAVRSKILDRIWTLNQEEIVTPVMDEVRTRFAEQYWRNRMDQHAALRLRLQTSVLGGIHRHIEGLPAVMRWEYEACMRDHATTALPQDQAALLHQNLIRQQSQLQAYLTSEVEHAADEHANAFLMRSSRSLNDCAQSALIAVAWEQEGGAARAKVVRGTRSLYEAQAWSYMQKLDADPGRQLQRLIALRRTPERGAPMRAASLAAEQYAATLYQRACLRLGFRPENPNGAFRLPKLLRVPDIFEDARARPHQPHQPHRIPQPHSPPLPSL